LYIITKRLIKISTKQWGSPSHNLLRDVYDILVKKVNKMVDDRFHRFRYGGLHQRVKSIVNEVLSERRASASSKVEWLLVMENAAPFTLNEHYFKDYREKFLKSYREARHAPELHEDHDSRISEPADSYNVKFGYRFDEDVAPREVSYSPKPEVIALDPYDQALHYMASARGYFQVAFKRFADMVPMTIDQELLRGLDWDRGLHSALTKGLGITGDGSSERAKEFLQETPDVKSRREGLLRRRERLQSAKRELQTI